MDDANTFDRADAAFQAINVALAAPLTSREVGGLIAQAEGEIAACDRVADVHRTMATDVTLPTRQAMAAKTEAEGLAFVAGRLRSLKHTLDSRRQAEEHTETQTSRQAVFDQAVKASAEAGTRLLAEYPKIVASLMAVVEVVRAADAKIEVANRERPDGADALWNVEASVGTRILPRLNVPNLDGVAAIEMTKPEVDRFASELWDRAQRQDLAVVVLTEAAAERTRLAARQHRAELADQHDGPESEKAQIRAGIAVRPRRIGMV